MKIPMFQCFLSVLGKKAFAIKICWVVLLGSVFIGCDSPEREAKKYYLEGLTHKEHGEWRQAFQQFYMAVIHNPRHVNAHVELGMLLCRDQRYAQAIKHLLRAIEYGDTTYKSYAYMGYAYEQLGNLTFSERYYKQAIDRAPELINVRLRLAGILEIQGQRGEAANILEEMITLNPDIEDKAILRARIALLRQPQSLDIHRAMAGVYIEHGKIKKGIAEYQKFESLDPASPETLATFGIFCAEKGQLKIAADYLEKAIELGMATQPEVRTSLAKIYEDLGNLHRAIEEYQAILQLQPDLSDIQWKLVDLLKRVKRYDEAADLLETLFYEGQVAETNVIWGEILRLRGENSKKAVVQLKRFGQYNLVDLLVNNTVSVTVIVDPDAQYTIISEELAQRLNIVLSTRTSDVHFYFYGRTLKAPLINLASIKVGGLEVRNIPTLVWDLSDYPQIEGVLGMSFLKHFQVEIRYKDELVVLTKPYS